MWGILPCRWNVITAHSKEAKIWKACATTSIFPTSKPPHHYSCIPCTLHQMLRYGSARPLLLGRGTMLPRLAARALATAPQVATEEECAAYYDTASHYDVLWGKDNIHIGYYPHLVDRTAVELSFQQAAGLIVNRMVALGDISHTSRVLDLGCGKGHACELIAKLTGAACTGLDLSPGNIERATALAASRPELSLDFVEGSFTSLPEQLRQGQFTHVISQEAFSHAHAEIHTIFDELKTTLSDEGLAIINDYLGNDVPVSEVSAAPC
eukprot:COSAG05_NODE_1589_length_4476_cov_118.433630_4_plen_267_part_00